MGSFTTTIGVERYEYVGLSFFKIPLSSNHFGSALTFFFVAKGRGLQNTDLTSGFT